MWILIRLRGCIGWSGSMLIANPLCWFCHGAAHIKMFNMDLLAGTGLSALHYRINAMVLFKRRHSVVEGYNI
jgi:hypothetical protein